MSFADKLIAIRTELNLKKSEAAIKIGMTFQQYESLEKPNSNPTMVTVAKVAKGLGVSPRKFL